ncbi:MAG: endonuclease/exonuclease/phosphatase family protein [Paludibacter sp.]|jgi:endonuclease/exonuclease/phosphatase family metal-dependent hydrolase|nr:endonuclease/exonuclease/phosphatase family protein [Paludibacter sp.]
MKKLLIKILVIANLAVAAAMLLVLPAGVISPAKFVWLAFAALAFPVLALLNILFSAFWLICRKWLFLISLVALAVCYKPLAITFPVNFSKNQTSETQNIKIVSYNVGAYQSLQKHTKKSPNKIVEFLLGTNADIICLQEFSTSKNPKFMTAQDFLDTFDAQGYKYTYIWYINPNNNDRVGLITLSKFPIVNKQKIQYQSFGNLSILSDIVINSDTVRVINNHLESNTISQVTYKKSNTGELIGIVEKVAHHLSHTYPIRAKQAEMVAKEIQNSSYKTIVCGDFNDVPASYTYNKIKGDLEDSFVETNTGLGWTYDRNIYRVRIDFVLHSKDLTAENFIVKKQKYSDHYPVTCTLSINN